MLKKLCNTDYSRSMEIVSSISSELYGSYPKKELRSVIQSALFGDRVFGYESHIRSACAHVLRWYEDSVYYFNGRCWSPLSDVLLEQSLNESLVKAHINKSDLIKARSNILRAAKQGASLSKLQPSRYVVGFTNGVYDFTDIDNPVSHPFSDRMDVLSVLPYDYDSTATCPKWIAFLKAILTPAQVSLLQKYLSLGVAPRDAVMRKIEKTLWLVGSGANGKSVIFEVVKAVYGDSNISSMSLHNLIKDGDDGARFRAVIVGKIFNYCTEVNTSDIPYLVFNMNKKPNNRTMGEAFMRRLLMIHFRTTVSKQDMRPDLVSELCMELSGIRNWLIQGYRELAQDGFKFSPTKESLEETEEYLLENGQTIQIFLRARGYRSIRYSGHWDEKPKYVAAQSLYNDYVAFCEKKMYEVEKMNAFGRELGALGYQKRKRSSNNVYEVFCENEISYAFNI